jgi:hydrogenase nickel incorporation protein HypA/HybF
LTSSIAVQNHLGRVTGVRVDIGRFSGVQPEALRFAWEILRVGTISEKASLEIEEIPIRVRCNFCGSEYIADPDDLSCPLCESCEYELISGRELNLKSVIGEPQDGLSPTRS